MTSAVRIAEPAPWVDVALAALVALAVVVVCYGGPRAWVSATAAGHRGGAVSNETEPREHTLSALLDSGWRWFSDPARNTVVVLHRSGLWVEFDADLWPDDGSEVWAQIAEAMSGAVVAGVTGQTFVLVTKHAAGDVRYSATLERVAA